MEENKVVLECLDEYNSRKRDEAERHFRMMANDYFRQLDVLIAESERIQKAIEKTRAAIAELCYEPPKDLVL